MRRRSFACRLVALFGVLAGMLSWTSSASARGRSAADQEVSTEISWRPCTEEEMLSTAIPMDCGSVTVPVDYAHPNGRTVSLFVSRHRSTAPDPVGPLFVNQGGPGAEAAMYALGFSQLPLVTWDANGTPRSGPNTHGEQ